MTIPVLKNKAAKACKKLGFEEKKARRGPHRKFVLSQDNKEIVRVFIPHGRDELRIGTQREIISQMHLKPSQFIDAVKCPFRATDYTKRINALIDEGKI